MALLKFKVQWEDDINVVRDIEILSTQSFDDFHECIKKSFSFPPRMHAKIFESDNKRRRLRALSSEVEKNLRDAPELSMKRTPVGALLSGQDQKFIYLAGHKKAWELNIELVQMSEVIIDEGYPRMVREEGVSPGQFTKNVDQKSDSVTEIEDKYALSDEKKELSDASKNLLKDLFGVSDDKSEGAPKSSSDGAENEGG